MGQLLLNRDFTRFFHDDDFPHSVQLHFGSKKIVCSGMVLAQQSTVLETMIRAENGVLVCQELADIGTLDHKIQCIEYLYGGKVTLDLDNIKTVLIFSSLYGVNDLFALSFNWIMANLTVPNLLPFYSVLEHLSDDHQSVLSGILESYLADNVSEVVFEVNEQLLKLDQPLVQPNIIVSILKHSLSANGKLLLDWISNSVSNKSYVLDNLEVIDIIKHFPSQEEFTNFIGILSSETSCVETMKKLMELQQTYFTRASLQKNSKAMESSGYNRVSIDTDKTVIVNSDWELCGDPESTVSVANIPSFATSKDVREFLSSFGDISGLEMFKICHRQQLAFVSFSVPTSAVELLASSSQHSILRSNVKIKPYDSLKLHPGRPEKRIFVCYVPKESSKRNLDKTFTIFGTIVDVEIIRHKKCAFVEFDDPEAVRKVLLLSLNGGVFKVLGAKVGVKQFRTGKG